MPSLERINQSEVLLTDRGRIVPFPHRRNRGDVPAGFYADPYKDEIITELRTLQEQASQVELQLAIDERVDTEGIMGSLLALQTSIEGIDHRQAIQDELLRQPAGQILMHTRYARSLSRDDLGEAIGVTGSTIASLELGAKAGSMRVLGGIFRYYGLPVSSWQAQLYLRNRLRDIAEVIQPSDVHIDWGDSLSPRDFKGKSMGESFRLLRESAGISLGEFSEMSGFTRKHLSAIERDQSALGTFNFGKMVLGYGLHVRNWQTKVLYANALRQA